MNNQPAKPKRRRFRFTLRTMFLVVFVMCLVVGWKANKAHQQRKAVAWVEEMGGTVSYEYEHDNDNRYIPDAEPPGPEWMRNLIGIDFFTEVASVDLFGTQVRDLAPLSMLTNLSELDLAGTPISDISSLTELTNLTSLDLSGRQVSEESVEQLRQALPNCIILSN